MQLSIDWKQDPGPLVPLRESLKKKGVSNGSTYSIGKLSICSIDTG